MTTELQRAMARYEEARAQYKKAVLASLNGASNGDAIREAIHSFQKANADLKRLTAPPPSQVASPALPERKRREAPEPFPVWGFMRRLLKAS